MRNQGGKLKSINKLVFTSFGTGLLVILSFFLMLNWTYGEYLIAPTLVFAVLSLIVGLVSIRKMKTSGENSFGNTKSYFSFFRVFLGVCILLWFLLAIFTHY